MVSPFGQFFRKDGGDSPAVPAGNEDLECGRGSSVSQSPTASGYQSSPSRVYLPESQSIHASTIPQTPTQSCEYFSHIQYNGQHGYAAQMPLTPSGPSRVVGYLPRTICSGSSSFVGPTRRIIPSQPSQNGSNRDLMSNSGAQRRSNSISKTDSRRSPSPRSPFDPVKHGQALRRLETHGSLKTIPSGQREGDALNRTSISWSQIGRELFGDDHAVDLRGSLPQQPEGPTSANPYETAGQQFRAELSSSSLQYFPHYVIQPAALSQGNSCKVVNLPDPPELEDGQSLREALPSFIFPLPNAEADDSNKVTQQALHRSQDLPKPCQALCSRTISGESIAADASPSLWSKSPNSEGRPEDDTTGSIVRTYVTQGRELSEALSAYEVERIDDQQRPIGNPYSERAHPVRPFVQSQTFEEMDEYLWSPAPSDDGQEASSAPYTPFSCHAPSDALSAFPISRLKSDPHDGFSRPSVLYGKEHLPSQSSSSGNPRVMKSPLPHIDILIPAGSIDLDSHSDFLSSSQHAPTMGSRESSSILFRYSGLITDGASSRPMSETELKEDVLNSLGDRAKTGLSMLSRRDSNSQGDCHTNAEQIRGDDEPNDRPDMFQPDRVQSLSAVTGPGSSQTSSSLSTDRHGGGPSSHKARLGHHDGLAFFRTRCPTPPLLFGRNAISGPEKSNTASMPAPGSSDSRFDQNMKTIRPKGSGRLPTALYSLGERDWETVTAETEADSHAFDGITFETKTGSSLADNSDSGSLSLSKETPYPFRDVEARPIMQHPAHPRHNHTFMLLKNSQTGDLIPMRQYEYASEGRLPNNNASTHLVSRVHPELTYQHPCPLQNEHKHPFTSSPSITRFEKPSGTRNDSPFVMEQSYPNSLSSSGLSEGVQEVKETQTQHSLYTTAQNAFLVRDPAVNQDQNVMEPKEQSHHSSAWLSTVSKVASSEPSPPGNRGTFTKMMPWDGKGHVNDTLEQGGYREVGSSLADASSPGANFSSSPAPPSSSPFQILDTPPSLGQGLHKQAIRNGLDYGNQHLRGDFHKSHARSFNRDDSVISTTNTEDRSRSHSASGPPLEHRKLSLQPRRSSSESHSRPMDSPSAQKASALNSSSSDSHAQQTNSSGLFLRNPFLHSDDNDSQYEANQHDVIERSGRQPKADGASIEDLSTPSSTNSRPFVRDGVVHTDVAPPILHHPVYGRDRPWDRIRPGHARPRAQPDPLGRPLFQRPVARAESPHLHRIPHPPTPELLERHGLISRIYLISCMVIPPIALIYGHGYMDGIMRFHTAGEINGFRSTEKTIALCWGYGLSAICVLAIVIAMIIISASG
ncbi:MAG: hypothetical protein ASARMPREDX12_003869 [Alectoria sarmentosa]|nr:MAG: hypothetical protein ASARMPREDX12_003869 [Alectoria sarmentosa]